jgi:hypothetical protein
MNYSDQIKAINLWFSLAENDLASEFESEELMLQ